MRRIGCLARGSHSAGRIAITAIFLIAAVAMTPIAVVRATNFIVTVNDTLDEIHNPGCAATGTGTCSLRDAILYANTKADLDTTAITVPAGIYTLTIQGRNEDAGLTGDLDIAANVILTGAGASATIIQASSTDSSAGIDRVFDIHSGNVTISGVTVRNGNPTPSFNDNIALGGGIRNFGGSLTLSNAVISGNNAAFNGVAASPGGGGIYTATRLTVVNSTISGNKGTMGGGITAQTSFSGPALLTITGSTISNNSAFAVDSPNAGGGILY